jgi:hypothetical protein
MGGRYVNSKNRLASKKLGKTERTQTRLDDFNSKERQAKAAYIPTNKIFRKQSERTFQNM